MPKDKKEEEKEKKQPVAKFRDGGLQISIWKQEGEKSDYHTALMSERSYFDDKSKEFKTTPSMKKQHLLAMARLCGKAYDKIVELDAVLKEEEKD